MRNVEAHWEAMGSVAGYLPKARTAKTDAKCQAYKVPENAGELL